MRAMLTSRSSREKPSPFERCVRTTSPSSDSTFFPSASSLGASASASVLLPAPERPVNHSTTPRSFLAIVLIPFRSLPSRGLIAIGGAENFGDLGARIFRRRKLALRQQPPPRG